MPRFIELRYVEDNIAVKAILLEDEMPRTCAAIIERLMAKDPLDRYQRPAILVADLMACAEAEGISLTVGRPVGAAELVSRPAASWMAWGVPVLLLGVLLAGLWWR